MNTALSYAVGALATFATLSSAAPAPSSNATVVSQRCCTLLAMANANSTFTSNSTVYQNSLKSYWSAQVAEVQPNCIFLPTTAQEIASVVPLLVNNTCPFSIRSGGHNPWPSNNIQPGVTIDMSLLSTVSTKPGTPASYGSGNISDTNGTIVQIGPGARWSNVYDFLTPMNLTVGGGRAADVGVGGLTIGGGNSFFAARYGFVCDSVENFQVVLASGEIVDANSTSNPDLWKVLKGGSNNFGIVTRIDLSTIEGAYIWGGIALYPEETIPAQITGFANFTNNIANDPYSSLISFWTYTSATNMTVVENCYEYTRPVSSPPAAFSELLALPAIPGTNTLRIGNLTNITKELEAPAGARDIFATLTFENDANLISTVYNISTAHRESMGTIQNLTWITMFQPIPTVFTERSEERGGNVMGLDQVNKNGVQLLIFATWLDPADDDKINTAANGVMSDVAAASKNMSNPWIYLNYATPEQKVLQGYGSANLALMRAAREKYDPNAVFQTLVPGGFKLNQVNGTN